MAFPAGRRNKRIAIQEKATVSDGGGGVTETWTAITNGTVWAEVNPLTGRERYQAQQMAAAVDWQIRVLFRDDIDPSAHRVLYGSKVLNIRAVLPDSSREGVTVLCEEERA